MNTFKFRGLHGKPGQEKFVYGYLTKDAKGRTAYYDTHSYRISWTNENGADCNAPVRNGTVGQCTGIEDMDGNLIFVGDIITKKYITPMGQMTEEIDSDFKYEVKMKHGCFGIETDIDFIPMIEFLDYSSGEYISNKGNKINYGKCFLKIIGNIHENKNIGEEQNYGKR